MRQELHMLDHGILGVPHPELVQARPKTLFQQILICFKRHIFEIGMN